MSQKSLPTQPTAEAVVRFIRRVTRRLYAAEDKIRVVLEGLRAEPCRRAAISPGSQGSGG